MIPERSIPQGVITDPRREEDSERDYALRQLSKMLPRGAYVFGLLDPSRTGASAYVRVFRIQTLNGEAWPCEITWHIHKATDLSVKDRGGCYWLCLKGHGYGRMEHIADKVAEALGFAEGDIIGKGL